VAVCRLRSGMCMSPADGCGRRWAYGTHRRQGPNC
jgi:hypothetical protein